MRIHDGGGGDLPALVLIHGLASSSRCWDRCLPELAARHRCLAVDMFTADRHHFDLRDMAAELRTELAGRGVTRATVIGHSMGGLVAMCLALQDAALVERLVLVGVPALPHRRRLPERMVDVARASMSTQASAVGVVVASVIRSSPLALAAATRATLSADLSAEAGDIRHSTLLVWGGDDTLVPIAVGEGLERLMPNARLEVLPRLGHQPMWEDAAAFCDVVRPFLTAGLSSSEPRR
jgi:pimeloyl-ACP methyl ester carboxylesterase